MERTVGADRHAEQGEASPEKKTALSQKRVVIRRRTPLFLPKYKTWRGPSSTINQLEVDFYIYRMEHRLGREAMALHYPTLPKRAGRTRITRKPKLHLFTVYPRCTLYLSRSMDNWLTNYLYEQNRMVPVTFHSRWVFPHSLLAGRTTFLEVSEEWSDGWDADYPF